MAEPRRLWIEGSAGHLECMLRIGEAPRAAVVLAHPHPLFGGTMHNAVVFHADRETHGLPATTLRFNFRGVGESAGSHDNGKGEVDDVAAALSFVRGLVPEGTPLVIVGYSFGSIAGLRCAVRTPDVRGMVAIGLPIRNWGVDEAHAFRRPFAVVQGEVDEYGTPDEVRKALGDLDPPAHLDVVPGAEHLFPRQAKDVGVRVAAAVRNLLSASP